MTAYKFQLSIEDVREARERLSGIIRVTPLLASESIPELFLKAENLQVTGSFKIRAAYNQLARIPLERRERGVVTSSSGNFAQGVAYAASLFGVSAKIVMMPSANPLKVQRTQSWGAETVFCEDRYEARAEMVRHLETFEGRIPIHPFDHPDAIAGNASIGLEILEQLPNVLNVVVPVSGGGLISGIAFTIKSLKPSVRIWGVQPIGSNAAHRSFQLKRRVSIKRPRTIADGLTAAAPGRITFPMIRDLVEGVLVVKEESILRAMQHLLFQDRLLVEPSGAVALAAIMERQIAPERTVLVLSGGVVESNTVLRAAQAI